MNPYQRDTLNHHLDQIKTLAPILICSMKIFIQIHGQQSAATGIDEAVENRNYLARRMTEEINEITRALEADGGGGGGGGGGVDDEMGGNSLMCNSHHHVSAMSASSELTFHEVAKKLNQFLATSTVRKQR